MIHQNLPYKKINNNVSIFNFATLFTIYIYLHILSNVWNAKAKQICAIYIHAVRPVVLNEPSLNKHLTAINIQLIWWISVP